MNIRPLPTFSGHCVSEYEGAAPTIDLGDARAAILLVRATRP